MKPITTEDYDKRKELLKKAGKYTSEIEKRIGYITDKIYETFNLKKEDWGFTEGVEAGEYGSFDMSSNKDKIFISSAPGLYDEIIITKEGEEWCFDCSIPTRWLFEDFEKELKDGKKLYEKKREEEKKEAKDKKELKKQKEAEMLKNIAAKLSDDEKKLLKKKLGMEE